MSAPAIQPSAQADPRSGSPPSQDINSQHATNQSLAAAAAGVSHAMAHGDANEEVSQEGRQSQLSPENNRLPSHASGISSVANTARPSGDDSSAHELVIQQGSAQQGEGIAEQPAAAPLQDTNQSAHDEGHSPHLATEALGSDLGEEDEGSGPEQDNDSAMQDEEDRSSVLRLSYGDPGLGSDSALSHGPRSVFDADNGEMELPEEGWMWSAVQTHLKLAFWFCSLTCLNQHACISYA